MSKNIYSIFFFLGLCMRLALLGLIVPALTESLYAPFMEATTEECFWNPWEIWLAGGGSYLAFPYGYVTWVILAPLSILFQLVQLPVSLAYGTSLLIIDISLFILLNKLLPGKKNIILLTYWFSPIVLFSTYIMGLNDLIPITLITFSLFMLSKKSWAISGFVLALSISSKISMVIGIPLFCFYFVNNKPLRAFGPRFLSGFIFGSLIFFLPFLVSDAGTYMLLSNPQMQEVLRLTVSIGDSVLYIIPLVYIVFLYSIWRLKRLNFSLLMASFGVVFLSLVLITMSSPGWFLWTIPFLVYYQAQSGKISMLLTLLFSCLFVLNVILSNAYLETQFIFSDNPWIPESFISIFYESSTFLYTLLFCIGALLAIRFWRESVVKNIFFRLSRKPFVIGIAGDSGSGKDTLVESLTDLFGNNAVSYLTGDDYHLWDRNKPMWNAITHLNPMANDLERYASDLVALVDGDTIKTRHYDHGTGLMSHPRELHSNDFILTAGLHALYLPILRDCYDLSIYLDIDEGLRRYLKIQRDVLHRGSSMEKVLDSMSKRSHDSIKFIKNQSTHADLILSLNTTSILPDDLHDFSEDQPLNLKLNVKSRMEFNEFSLRRVLIGVCGLKVDILNNDSSFELDIEGEIKGEVIAEAFALLFPELIEFLRVDPQWSNGTVGLMQLIVLSHMNQAFKKRTI